MDKVRFGIVGLGEISKRFASILNQVDGVELTAVASRNPARTKAFANQFGAKKSCQNYLDVITDDDVDIVYDGLTINLHYEITKFCLENHKATLCEKSLVTSKKEAVELAGLARQNKVLLVEAMWTRFMPAFQKAREWVREGKVGQVKLISTNFCFKADYEPADRLFDPKLGGGSLYDVGIYPIDFAIGILDEHPLDVAGLAQFSPSGVDESVAMSLGFASGALANLGCGFMNEAPRTVHIFGTGGHLDIDDCVAPQKCELYDGNGNLAGTFFQPVADGFIYQIEHVASLFRSGKLESELMPLKDSIACAGVFDALNSQWNLTKRGMPDLP
jgi:predicted dehydrogenase